MKFELTPRMMKLLMHINNKGFVTKDTRPFLTTMRYYNYLWSLRDMNLIECNGVDENTQQKKWQLTEKGAIVAGKIKEIEGIVLNES